MGWCGTSARIGGWCMGLHQGPPCVKLSKVGAQHDNRCYMHGKGTVSAVFPMHMTTNSHNGSKLILFGPTGHGMARLAVQLLCCDCSRSWGYGASGLLFTTS